MTRKGRDHRQSIAVRIRDNFTCVFCGGKAKQTHHIFGRHYQKITSQIAVCPYCARLADAHQLPLTQTVKIPFLLFGNMVKAKLHALKAKKGKCLAYHLVMYWWK